MPEATDIRDRQTMPLLFGGISQQPPHARFANQVENAYNADFSVADGFSKRPGTIFLKDLTAQLAIGVAFALPPP